MSELNKTDMLDHWRDQLQTLNAQHAMHVWGDDGGRARPRRMAERFFNDHAYLSLESADSLFQQLWRLSTVKRTFAHLAEELKMFNGWYELKRELLRSRPRIAIKDCYQIRDTHYIACFPQE